MTGRNLSLTAKQAAFAQTTDEVFIVLLTINHASFAEPIRVASDAKEYLPDAGVRGVISRGQEYIYLPFNIELPTQDDTGGARASISIDNISREIVAAVRQATSAINVTIEVVLASDVDTPEVTMPDFRLEKVNYDALTISGDISLEYFDLEPFPSKRFTPPDFPGMF